MQRQRGNLKPVFGTARSLRPPEALAPEYAPIDERTCASRMAYALEFAKLLAYYDETNRCVSDWTVFFERDLSFLLANIVSTDFRRERFAAGAMQQGAREGQNNIEQILNTLFEMILRIDSWYQKAAAIAFRDRADNTLRMTLESIIQSDLSQQFGAHFDRLLQDLDAFQPPPQGSWSEFWKPRAVQLSGNWMPSELAGLTAPAVVHHHPLYSLLQILHNVNRANESIQHVARTYLEKDLAAIDSSSPKTADGAISTESSHAPHTALFIAFVKLLETLRDKINTITGRHLDFYYRKVLDLGERGSSPDVAHLTFELTPNVSGFMLPAGTRLAAGKGPDGMAREFATSEDLFINRARISSKKALYLATDLLAAKRVAHMENESPAAQESLADRVTGVLALPTCDSADGIGAVLVEPEAGWPTFGINEITGRPLITPALNAELGFVVSSSVLLLEEGERTVEINIAFQGEGTLESALQRYQDAASALLDTSLPMEWLLADAFCVAVSTASGWMPIESASFRRHPVVGTTLAIAFTLAPTDRAVVGQPALAPDGVGWPMVKITLNPLARVYAYSFFKGLTIESIELRVSADGVAKLQIRNEVGLLSAAQPFAIFGPVPVQGSYLLMSHPELAAKNVQHLTIAINWFNPLPPPGDLASYYSAYKLGIGDDTFKIRVTICGDPGVWTAPADGPELTPLFLRDYDHGGVTTYTTLALTMPDLPAPAAQSSIAPALTEAEAPRGSIRMELAEPVFGFGQAVFPAIMSEAAAANARAGKKGPIAPLPNPPLVPVTKSLTLSYEASDRLDLSRPIPTSQQAGFSALHPFGYEKHIGRQPSMIPELGEQGHLCLGLANAGARQSLSLLFQIRDGGFSPLPELRHHHDLAQKPLRWRYLSQNKWKEIPVRLVLSDSTRGLTRSGIVQFLLPDDITTNNTILPSGLCWIEAASEKVGDTYWCQIVSIQTQAVTATRVCEPNSALTPPSLPAGTISQLCEKKPQIKTVTQPFATSEGRSRETAAEFRVRVSERLRHKGRAIQAFDYERLVLDRFPQVGQVKCIGNNQSRFNVESTPVPPGTLYLVVTPRLEESTDPTPRLPLYVLKEIEEFIRPLASAHLADLHAMNPVYETLKVFTSVEFTTGGDASYYSDDLDHAISRWLCPWGGTKGNPMPIGSGQVQGYQLAKFIVDLPYVRRLESLFILHTYQNEDGWQSRWRFMDQMLWATAPWGVLIPAVRHAITVVGAESTEIARGIGNLTVGEDFVVPGRDAQKRSGPEAEQRYVVVIPRSTVSAAFND
ncbi:MAG: baseplate J/gp47 family protein [Terracidiphilus sp.]|jgi:hypothetical protein